MLEAIQNAFPPGWTFARTGEAYLAHHLATRLSCEFGWPTDPAWQARDKFRELVVLPLIEAINAHRVTHVVSTAAASQ
jgi:hypothetical protein